MKRIFNVDTFVGNLQLGSPYGSLLMPSKNETAIFCLTASEAPAGVQTLMALAIPPMAYVKVVEMNPEFGDLVPRVLEITLASGSIYEFVATGLTVDPALEALVSGPCCDDPYPL